MSDCLFEEKELVPDFKGIKGKETDEWATPFEIIQALGPFDLDPCAMKGGPWECARVNIYLDEEHNGLTYPWFGLVWCNPPYSQKKLWVMEMNKHRRGIMLLPDSLDAPFFHLLYPKATAILALRGRVRFRTKRGTPGENPSNGSLFVAYGRKAAFRLYRAWFIGNLKGTWIKKPWWFVVITKIAKIFGIK
jgi:hypothetical protein